MKTLLPYYLIFGFIIAICSCSKKQSQIVPATAPTTTKAISYRDSISFSIGSQSYVFDQKYKLGIGNQAVNVKPSSTIISGGKLAYQTGGLYWYGTPDSTLYSVFYDFSSNFSSDNLNIYFTKKYKDSELVRGPTLLYDESHLDIFKKGKQSFAVDFDKENTLDGVVIELYNKGKTLTTAIPGFSILVRSNLKNDIQNNSSFEITKVEQLQDDKYLVEANFSANLFDEDAKLYRVTNGFVRFTTSVKPVKGGFIFL